MTGLRASACGVVDKHCSQCDRWLPATTENFYASSRNPDGTPRTLKSWCIPCSNRASKESHRRRQERGRFLSPVELEGNVKIPIGPFREWLRGRLAAHDGSEEALAVEIGVMPRACYRWLHETFTIGIDQVDRALIASGTATLREVYPELYEFDDAQKAA